MADGKDFGKEPGRQVTQESPRDWRRLYPHEGSVRQKKGRQKIYFVGGKVYLMTGKGGGGSRWQGDASQ